MKFPLLSGVLVFAICLDQANAAPASVLSGDFKGPLGLQLYTFRESFKTNVVGTLDRIKELGFVELEGGGDYGLGREKFQALLKERGLQVVSAGFGYKALHDDLAGSVQKAKDLGVKFAMCAWIDHDTKVGFTEADVRRAAADFNKWGEAFATAGVTFAYHPHGYEFRPVKAGGEQTHFDLLVQETKPEFVHFEMDVFWVTHPGQDPVALLDRYPKRWVLMHLKDLRKGAATGIHTGHAQPTDDVTVGTGQVYWPAVLKHAADAGVKHFFIEDESLAPFESVPVSVKYLQSVKICDCE